MHTEREVILDAMRYAAFCTLRRRLARRGSHTVEPGIADAMAPGMATRGIRSARLLRLFATLVMSLGAWGCALPTKIVALSPEIPRDATKIAIDAGLESLEEAETKRRIERMLASPEMRAAERELVAGIVDGSLSALSEQDRVERVGALTSRYMAGVLRSLSREVAPELAPAASQAVRGAVRSALSEALSARNQREVQRLVGSVAEAGARPLVKILTDAEIASALSDALTEKLGPALQQVLRENIGPGIAEALSDEEIQSALGASARVMGREVVLGVNEALVQIQESKSSGGESLLGRLGNLASNGAKLAVSLTWLLVAAVLVLAVWIVKLLSQTRRYRGENEQRAATTRLLAEAMRASKGKPWSGELLAALEERIRAEEEALLDLRGALKRGRKPPRGGDDVPRETPRNS